MSKLAKALQAAAGNSAPAGELANAIDFDGTSDYLLRSSALTGSADGKTFTFSAWVYISKYLSSYNTVLQGNGQAFNFSFGSDNFYIKCLNSSNTAYPLDVAVDLVQAPKDTFIHILASIDMTSQAATRIYVNDVLQTLNFRSAFVNTNLDLTPSSVAVGALTNGSNKFQGRISNLYLDYTYRNLDVVANRRLFITDDLKPADGQADLNPILYLPLDDPEDIGNNAGTGGNFTVNGVMARSGRGPNQDNTVASYFNGSNNDLYRAGAYGADSKTLTISFCYSSKAANTQLFNSVTSSGDDNIYVLATGPYGGLQIGTLLNNASNYAVVVQIPDTVVKHNITYAISVSFDSSDTSKRHVFVNGVDKTASVTWNYYNLNSFVGFSLTSRTRLGAGWASGSNSYFWGNLGEFYLSKDYTDLASNNPFWDSDLGKPISIRKVLADTGNTPLIAMPIEANNAGLNLGTSGNFTVNSGPFTGARGASEYIARSTDFISSTTVGQFYGSFPQLNIGSTVGTIVISFTTRGNNQGTIMRANSNDCQIRYYSDGTIYFDFNGVNSSVDNWLFGTTSSSGIVFDGWNTIMLQFDNSSTSATKLYLNGAPKSFTYFDTRGRPLFCKSSSMNIGFSWTNSIANVYITPEAIDFTQEANRLKFIDAFGYPLDLQPAIDNGDIPNPVIYLKMQDPSNLGLNSGTGGNFTVASVLKAGADLSK